MPSSAVPQEKRRVGRPRKRNGSSVAAPPKEEILRVAAELFAERGICDVSMLEIAQAVGLGQSSLYYWYRRKELIVAELLQQVNRLPLAFARQLESKREAPDLQLYRLVRFDVHNVCTFPLEITEIHRFSQRDPAAFETYWLERVELIHTIQQLVERGMGAGTFLEVDAYLTAVTIIAQDESVQNWYPRPNRSSMSVRDSADPTKHYEPFAISEFVASRTVGSLLTAPARLEALKGEAREAPR
jgi:TetR/AcrR family transcriptional regulator